MERGIFLALLIVGAGAFAGCLAPPAATPSSRPVPTPVVALVDTGINPYHEAFETDWSSLPSNLASIGATPVQLSRGGDYESAVAADAGFWGSIERGRLYWFEGTRVLAIAFSSETLQGILDDATSAHGTGTAHAILTREPSAIIVMVETSSEAQMNVSGVDPTHVLEGITWATSQPWIDIISLSLGLPAGAPVEGLEDVPNLTMNAVRDGKVVVVAAGNDPTLHVAGQFQGPPWVLSVGGAVSDSQGETTFASKAPDFVGDFIFQGACGNHVSDTCEYLGTSFATPLIAGTIAQTVRDLRSATGHVGGIRDGALVDAGGMRVSNGDLREAFNRTAIYWNTTDYRPAQPPVNTTNRGLLLTPFYLTTPIGPAPWTQMGWGYVGPSMGEEVAWLILANASFPEKPAAAVAHMAAVQDAREAYWAQQD